MRHVGRIVKGRKVGMESPSDRGRCRVWECTAEDAGIALLNVVFVVNAKDVRSPFEKASAGENDGTIQCWRNAAPVANLTFKENKEQFH